MPNSKKEKLPATPPKPATVAENEESDDDIAIVGEVEAPPKKPAPPGMATVEINLCLLFLGLESFPWFFCVVCFGYSLTSTEFLPGGRSETVV